MGNLWQGPCGWGTRSKPAVSDLINVVSNSRSRLMGVFHLLLLTEFNKVLI